MEVELDTGQAAGLFNRVKRMVDSEKKEKAVIPEPSLESNGGKLPECHIESKHPKKKKEEKEIEELKKKLEEKEKETKEYYDRMLRQAADLENFKKRAAKDKEEWTKFANEDLIKAILPVIDNLERAVNHAEKVADTGVMIEGVRLTIKQILQTLNRFGLASFESVGKPFDPSVHEAMLVVESDQHQPNHVVEEFQKGYLLNSRLLRPATVSVSKPPEKEVERTE
jgi:molecular chaperone GrpE